VIKQSQSVFAVKSLCRVLKVSRSGYYDWLKREPSKRQKEDRALKLKIQWIWEAKRQAYGYPRIWAELRAEGLLISRKRVARLMRELALKSKKAKPFKPKTTISDPSHPVAPNHLARKFEAKAPNQKWLVDITYVATKEGWLYVAGVLDLYSRKIVGLAMDSHMRSELVERALTTAQGLRQPKKGLLHHSDRGSQYTGKAYRKCLRKLKAKVSMSAKGDCWDNAPMESFWASLKREAAFYTFGTRAEARAVIFDYVMIFYNRQRRHSSLGYLSPEQFEQHYWRQLSCP
jgi:putative transposase